jgi:hypothetical protein
MAPAIAGAIFYGLGPAPFGPSRQLKWLSVELTGNTGMRLLRRCMVSAAAAFSPLVPTLAAQN